MDEELKYEEEKEKMLETIEFKLECMKDLVEVIKEGKEKVSSEYINSLQTSGAEVCVAFMDKFMREWTSGAAGGNPLPVEFVKSERYPKYLKARGLERNSKLRENGMDVVVEKQKKLLMHLATQMRRYELKLSSAETSQERDQFCTVLEKLVDESIRFLSEWDKFHDHPTSLEEFCAVTFLRSLVAALQEEKTFKEYSKARDEEIKPLAKRISEIREKHSEFCNERGMHAAQKALWEAQRVFDKYLLNKTNEEYNERS